jgi:outer membrane protein TolC
MKIKQIYNQLRVLLSAIFFLILGISNTRAQETRSLSLDSCYAWAQRNYPLVKQMALIEKTLEYSLDNISKGYFPQLSINGQASYQSEVTEVPLPASTLEPISKDQYKLYAELNQPITDAILISKRKELTKATTVIESQNLEVELYKLKDRINNLFFGVILIDAQLRQVEILKKDIQNGINKTKAALSNGVATKSNVDQLTAELLVVGQKTVELKANRKGLLNMLSLFINKDISENDGFIRPELKILNEQINRPELKLFDAQRNSLEIQNKLIGIKNIPRLSLFVQGGYGRPALNMLNNDLNSYYIGGLRLNWNISNLYTFKKEKKINSLQQNSIDAQKETFLFNTNMMLKQQSTVLSKYNELISSDREIISLREGIKNTANSSLENGTITTNDYLSFLNAEDQSRQNLLLHEIQLLMAQYSYQTISGN